MDKSINGYGPDLSDSLLPQQALAHEKGHWRLSDSTGESRQISASRATEICQNQSLLLCHLPFIADKLNIDIPSRRENLFDILELYAFVRPTHFTAPSVKGLCHGLNIQKKSEEGPAALFAIVEKLLDIFVELQPVSKINRYKIAALLNTKNWAFAPLCLQLLDQKATPNLDNYIDGCQHKKQSDPFKPWDQRAEWQEHPPRGVQSLGIALTKEEARNRLHQSLQNAGLTETRQAQLDLAAATTSLFSPRQKADKPEILLAQAGTGVGKTLAYLAPAAAWAEKNETPVWISTYTKALQRQISTDFSSLFEKTPTETGDARAVVRKGRENYLCWLNLQESLSTNRRHDHDEIALGLLSLWALETRDGDLQGGDFPAWLPSLFPYATQQLLSRQNLSDMRGECIHSACPYYKKCWIEKARRDAMQADLVIANHALTLTLATQKFADTGSEDPADAGIETQLPRRMIFDEGHHLFQAADSAFSSYLSGRESHDLRRWILGGAGKGSRRRRGLTDRLEDLLESSEGATQALAQLKHKARCLAGDGWQSRLGLGPAFLQNGTRHPRGSTEKFLAQILIQIETRCESKLARDLENDLECPLFPAMDGLLETGAICLASLSELLQSMRHLEGQISRLLSEPERAAKLDMDQKLRLRTSLRGLRRRSQMQLPGWIAAIETLLGEEDPKFVDRLVANIHQGLLYDCGLERRWLDPGFPLHKIAFAPLHGGMITSATLADQAEVEQMTANDIDRDADLPLPAEKPVCDQCHWPETSRYLGLDPKKDSLHYFDAPSPFPYHENSRLLVINDLDRQNMAQLAAAIFALAQTAGGSVLSIFTAIKRLRRVYPALSSLLAGAGIPLLAQHVDPFDPGTLIDIFKIEGNAVLMGTDAIRDGVDIPGDALRMILFDRVPWSVPDLVHKSRRKHFGKSFDDRLARRKLRQAYGRLIRRRDDFGLFIILDSRTPTRLFSSFPPGVEPLRMGLADAITFAEEFYAARI